MMRPSTTTVFFLCINNGGSPGSLEVRKIYEGLPDLSAERRGLLRIIDESGEDYLHPAELFVPIKLASPILKALAKTEPHNEPLQPTKPARRAPRRSAGP